MSINLLTMLSNLDSTDFNSIIFTILVGMLLICILLKFPKTKVPAPGIPMVPNSHWFFGHSQILIRDFKESWWKLCYEHADDEGLCSFWNFSRPAITVNTVDNARAILIASSSKPALGHMRKHLRMLLGEKSLPFLNGKEWKHHRNLYSKALSSKAVSAMLTPVRDVVASLVKALGEKMDNENQGGPVEMNIENIIQLVMADISGKIFFGMDFGCCRKLEQIPITRAIKFLVDEISRRITSPLNPAARFYSFPSALNRQHRENIQLVRNTLKGIIEKRKLSLSSSSSSSENHDFITSVLKNCGSEEKSDEIPNENIDEVIDSLLTAHMASFDSSTASLVYIFYCLACHPHAEEECLKEIQRVLHNESNVLDPDHLPYCNAVVTETIRLYPAIVAISRTLEKPFKFKNVTVKAGTDVLIPFWHIQRDERNFHRANEFLPERWVTRNANNNWVENSSSSKRITKEDMLVSDVSVSSDDTTLPGSHPDNDTKQVDNTETLNKHVDTIPAADKSAFLSFSAGGRSCVGYKLAKKDICIVMVELLRNFKFELVQGFKLNPRSIAVSQKQIGGIPMIISKRK